MNKDLTEREKIWHGIAAASLSVVAGLGHLYLGISRGNVLIACSAAFFLIGRFYWPPAEWLYIQFAIISGFFFCQARAGPVLNLISFQFHPVTSFRFITSIAHQEI